MITKSLDQLTAADLASLVTNAVEEGRKLDYKRELPGSSDADKRELCADVSSFANTSGGYLLFGVDEDQGVPIGLLGLTELNIDETRQIIENLVRDCVKPRLPGLSIGACNVPQKLDRWLSETLRQPAPVQRG